MKQAENMKAIFGQIQDHKSHVNRLHDLTNILIITIVAVLCGAETWEQMSEFGSSKEDFLKKFLDLPNGIPSKDTFRRVFEAIDSEAFERCFTQWIGSIADLFKGQVIAVDGKTLCGAKTNGEKSPIYMVSAFACANGLVLGQVRTRHKSNETTATPELLKLLDLEGMIITIDAMGTQTEIAETIIDGQADYILAVKDNQPQLMEHVLDEFRFVQHMDTHTSEDVGHGRIETRICSVVNDFKFLNGQEQWKELKSVVRIQRTREFKNSDKPIEKSVCYYISSLRQGAKSFQGDIRSHWSIENKLHWSLDVGMSEDASRKRTGNAAQNYSVVLKIALNLLKQEKNVKQGIKGKRLKAAWDNQYLSKLINIKV